MTTVDNDFKQKLSKNFECKTCEYVTCRKSNYDNHLLSTKHMKRSQITTLDNDFKQILSKKYMCDICKKEAPLQRTYFRYNIKCQCHSPYHFELIIHCKDCIVKEPKETKVVLLTSNLEKNE